MPRCRAGAIDARRGRGKLTERTGVHAIDFAVRAHARLSKRAQFVFLVLFDAAAAADMARLSD